IEHDFDLTPLGYELCEKPLQNYIYRGDDKIINTFCELYPFIKKGVVVSGDSFICDDNKRNFMKERFGAMSCDMESAAIAYVADLAKIPFVTLRKISDDAGSDANESYTAALNIDGKQVLEILLSVIEKL
ncbi:MAG: 5'-methylthioadenosine/S-adenosylhomocysteine nucleosidase, partial [Clostridia bacterium]|nr:5'-methylthioadenosine/S-adenosylhomocysteine nucleosidase [Clostridia bacterium]